MWHKRNPLFWNLRVKCFFFFLLSVLKLNVEQKTDAYQQPPNFALTASLDSLYIEIVRRKKTKPPAFWTFEQFFIYGVLLDWVNKSPARPVNITQLYLHSTIYLKIYIHLQYSIYEKFKIYLSFNISDISLNYINNL